MKNTLLFLFIGLLSSNVEAFTFNTSSAAYFHEDNIGVLVADLECENIGLTLTELQDLLKQATDRYWNRAPTSRLKLEVRGLVNKPTAFRTDSPCSSTSGGSCTPNPALISDHDIIVSCNGNMDTFPSNQILAVTAPNNVEGRRIRSSIILINDRPGNVFSERSEQEQVAVLAHELGHAIGLGHSPVQDSLMYFRAIPKRRSLGQDDIDGVTYLYPHQIGPSTCGSVALIAPDDTNRLGPSLFLLFSALLLILQGLKLVPKRSHSASY